MLTRGLQPNVVEKGDVGTLKLHRVILAINLDRKSEEKLQTTVPDVVRAERKLLHPRGADEDTVLPVKPTILLIREWPALQTLTAGMHRVSNLQSSKQSEVAFSKHGLSHLRTVTIICVNTCCVMLIRIATILARSP